MFSFGTKLTVERTKKHSPQQGFSASSTVAGTPVTPPADTFHILVDGGIDVIVVNEFLDNLDWQT